MDHVQWSVASVGLRASSDSGNTCQRVYKGATQCKPKLTCAAGLLCAPVVYRRLCAEHHQHLQRRQLHRLHLRARPERAHPSGPTGTVDGERRWELSSGRSCACTRIVGLTVFTWRHWVRAVASRAGGFQIWGNSPHNTTNYFWGRSPADIAYAIAQWFARGGSHMNYYMWFGGEGCVYCSQAPRQLAHLGLLPDTALQATTTGGGPVRRSRPCTPAT